MIGETILHYYILEKLGEPAGRQGRNGSTLYLGVNYARRNYFTL